MLQARKIWDADSSFEIVREVILVNRLVEPRSWVAKARMTGEHELMRGRTSNVVDDAQPHCGVSIKFRKLERK
jgi:hypothetical protein